VRSANSFTEADGLGSFRRPQVVGFSGHILQAQSPPPGLTVYGRVACPFLPGKRPGIPEHPRAVRETHIDEDLGDLARLQGTWTGKTGINGYFQTLETFN
jgi:hypothetical protein